MAVAVILPKRNQDRGFNIDRERSLKRGRRDVDEVIRVIAAGGLERGDLYFIGNARDTDVLRDTVRRAGIRKNGERSGGLESAREERTTARTELIGAEIGVIARNAEMSIGCGLIDGGTGMGPR